MTQAHGSFALDAVGAPIGMICSDRGPQHGSGGRPHPKRSPEPGDLCGARQHACHVDVDPFNAMADGARCHRGAHIVPAGPNCILQ